MSPMAFIMKMKKKMVAMKGNQVFASDGFMTESTICSFTKLIATSIMFWMPFGTIFGLEAAAMKMRMTRIVAPQMLMTALVGERSRPPIAQCGVQEYL